MPVERFAAGSRADADRARRRAHGRCVVALPGARHPLACRGMAWEPEPGWLSVPGGTGPSTVGRLAHRARRPAARRQAARPVPARRPAGAQRPDPLRLLAARGRRRRVGPDAGSTPGPARAGRRPSRRTPPASPSPPTGSRTPASTGCSSPTPSAGSPPPTWATGVAGARPAAAADRSRRAPRRLADPGPHRRGRPRRQPVVAPRALPPAVRRPAAGRRTTATWRRRTCAAARATWSWRSTGRAWASGRSAPTSACTWPARARPRAVARRLPARPAGAARPTSPLPTRCASVPASSRRTPPSAAPSGPWPGWRAARARSRPSSATQRRAVPARPRRVAGEIEALLGLTRELRLVTGRVAPRDVHEAATRQSQGATRGLLDGGHRERVAGLQGALGVAGLEPLHAGGGRAVGPLLLVDPAGRLLLDPVVADGLGRVDGLLDVLSVRPRRSGSPSASSVAWRSWPTCRRSSRPAAPARTASLLGPCWVCTWPIVPSRFWMWWPYSWAST